RIPPAFVKYMKKDITKTTLECPNGMLWVVQLQKRSSGLYLESGWQEFVKGHCLKNYDLLVFGYDGGVQFTVQIYDRTACESEDVCIKKTSPDHSCDDARKEKDRRQGDVNDGKVLDREELVHHREELLPLFVAPAIRLMKVQGQITYGVSFYNFFHEELNVVLEMQNYHTLVGLCTLHYGETDVGSQFEKSKITVLPLKQKSGPYHADPGESQNDGRVKIKMKDVKCSDATKVDLRRRRQLPVDDKVEKAREKANYFTSKFPYFLSQMTNAGTRRGGMLNSHFNLQYAFSHSIAFVSVQSLIFCLGLDGGNYELGLFLYNFMVDTALATDSQWCIISHMQHLPRGFHKQHFPRGRMQMVLQSPDGTPWEVNYVSNRYHGSLSRGWDAFSRYHNLAVGDFCTFELVEEKTLRAQIFRVVD
ncbi:hypothetical protein ACLOJK_039105, partial [Asimina triloba]